MKCQCGKPADGYGKMPLCQECSKELEVPIERDKAFGQALTRVLRWVQWSAGDHQFKPKSWYCRFCHHQSSVGPERIKHGKACPYDLVQREAARLDPQPSRRKRAHETKR